MALHFGIIEIRNIIKIIQEYYGDDFSNHAMTSFRRRLAGFAEKKKIAHTADFAEKLKTSDFYQDFLYSLAVEDTEMFRDPETWTAIKDTILPKACKNGCKIWMAGSNTGEELYSLIIMLYENNYLQNVELLCSTFSQKRIDEIKSGNIPYKKLEISDSNYKRFKGLHNYYDYFSDIANKPVFNTNLLDNVSFSNLNLMRDILPDDVDVLIYRNQMLYFNRVLQHKILENLQQSLNKGGFLIIGNKESIDSFNIYNSFTTINKAEGIYKKPAY